MSDNISEILADTDLLFGEKPGDITWTKKAEEGLLVNPVMAMQPEQDDEILATVNERPPHLISYTEKVAKHEKYDLLKMNKSMDSSSKYMDNVMYEVPLK